MSGAIEGSGPARDGLVSTHNFGLANEGQGLHQGPRGARPETADANCRIISSSALHAHQIGAGQSGAAAAAAIGCCATDSVGANFAGWACQQTATIR